MASINYTQRVKYSGSQEMVPVYIQFPHQGLARPQVRQLYTHTAVAAYVCVNQP